MCGLPVNTGCIVRHPYWPSPLNGAWLLDGENGHRMKVMLSKFLLARTIVLRYAMN